MTDLVQTFYSPFVAFYLIGVVLLPFIIPLAIKRWNRNIAHERKSQGLDDKVLRNPEAQLKLQRKQAGLEIALFIFLAGFLPFLLVKLSHDHPGESEKISLAFTVFLLWVLVSGTSIAKNFLGGLAFRAISAFSTTLQEGDRATLSGHHGVVQKIGTFYTKIQTLDDDLVSVPTASLLDSALSSTNAGARSSLCVIPFYLSPSNSAEKLQDAENIIWDAIQSSTYFDFSNPIKILYSQTETSIVLKAKAYVASTYDEAEFSSEITKKALTAFDQDKIDLSKISQISPSPS